MGEKKQFQMKTAPEQSLLTFILKGWTSNFSRRTESDFSYFFLFSSPTFIIHNLAQSFCCFTLTISPSLRLPCFGHFLPRARSKGIRVSRLTGSSVAAAELGLTSSKNKKNKSSEDVLIAPEVFLRRSDFTNTICAV